MWLGRETNGAQEQRQLPEDRYSRDVHPELQLANRVLNELEGWQWADFLFWRNRHVSCPAIDEPFS